MALVLPAALVSLGDVEKISRVFRPCFKGVPLTERARQGPGRTPLRPDIQPKTAKYSHGREISRLSGRVTPGDHADPPSAHRMQPKPGVRLPQEKTKPQLGEDSPESGRTGVMG
jgi:hypothetical protein